MRSIEAKYCIDISTVFKAIQEVKKKEIKKKWIDNKTLFKVADRKLLKHILIQFHPISIQKSEREL